MPTFYHRFALIAALTSLRLAVALPAQELTDLKQSLANLQTAYREQVELVSNSMRRLYVERLRSLELKAAQAEMYESAQAYHEEAERMRAKLGAAAEGPLQVLFLAAEGTRSNGLTLSGQPYQALTGWRPGVEATWNLPAIPQGGYEVEVTHRRNRLPVSFRLAASRYHVTGTLQAASSSGQPSTRSSMGNLRLTTEESTLTLTLENSDAAEMVEIENIVLISHAP